MQLTIESRSPAPELPAARQIVRAAHPAVPLKRVIDVALALFGLLAGLPLMALIALAIKLDSRGPVLYRQDRVGFRGRCFGLWKFRTMTVDADARLADLMDQNEMSGPMFKMRNDPRVTRVGRLLRRSSLDELPQLWNVLSGDMSMVGPRPNRPHEVAQYREGDHIRLQVKPGLTCLWQIRGRNHAQFEAWMEYDREYVNRMSIGLDLWIILRTVWVVLRCEGAY